MSADQPTALLIGAGGQLGRELGLTLQSFAKVISSSRLAGDLPCDLSDETQVAGLLETVRPQYIVNASAYTAVDRAETEPDQAYRLNRDLPAQLAGYCAAHSALLTHYSTDYVFDGTATRPYTETDATCPISVYGSSKLAGEVAITRSGCRHLIFRTAWVYGRHGSNFVKTISRLALQGKPLNIVSDQIGRPVCAFNIAQLSAAALGQCHGLQDEQCPSGIYHLSADGEPVSWHGFANTFLNWLRQHQDQANLSVPESVDSSAFPTAAKRPAYSVLDNSRFSTTFGLEIPTWEQQLQAFLPDLNL